MTNDIEESRLYTIILDYDGGTFVSQVTSASLIEAKRKWAAELDLDAIGVDRSQRAAIQKEISDENAVPLQGMAGVWCLTTNLAGRMAIVHIVATAVSDPGS